MAVLYKINFYGGASRTSVVEGGGALTRAGYANTPETRWYYVLYVLKFILYNTAMYYLSVQ